MIIVALFYWILKHLFFCLLVIPGLSIETCPHWHWICAKKFKILCPYLIDSLLASISWGNDPTLRLLRGKESLLKFFN